MDAGPAGPHEEDLGELAFLEGPDPAQPLKGTAAAEPPPTGEELDGWAGWETQAVRTLGAALLEDGPSGERPERNALEQEAEKRGLTLARALVIRERVFAVLGERSRLAAQKAIVSGYEEALRVLPAQGPQARQLRGLLRLSRGDLRDAVRAGSSRATYGDAWVDAILKKEARLARAYAGAAEHAGGPPPSEPGEALQRGAVDAGAH
ncbi:MAG: hypothetical protein FJ086_05420 [Deltaproteobacteria bacterium]|nr:hypothetical protein [Deltaproteobacteria bacterium]